MNSKRLCRQCRDYFRPENVKDNLGFCSESCKLNFAIDFRDKEHQKRLEKVRLASERRKMKDAEYKVMKRESKANDKPYRAKMAQAAFNAFIRYRDKGLPCISCQRHHSGQYHAGHFKTVGAHPELRFNEYNCNSQCAPCNNHLSGNILEYRKWLIEKIGLIQVEWLEGGHAIEKRTAQDYKEIELYYKAKIKEL